MTWRYSFETEEELKRYLDRIRRIAKLDDESALNEVDDLVCEISRNQDGFASAIRVNNVAKSSDISTIDVAVRDCQEELDKFEKWAKDIDANEPEDDLSFSPFSGGPIEAVKLLRFRYDQDTFQTLQDRYQGLLVRAEQIQLQMGIKNAKRIIKYGDVEIHNITSIRGIVKRISEAASFLEHNDDLDQDLIVRVREIKETCAWHRAKKSLAEMEVAEKSARLKKAATLREQAKAQLDQDWAEIFGMEKPPRIIW